LRILVTGATGLVGANLTRALLEDDCTVRILLRPASDPAALRDLAVERATGDVQDLDSLEAAAAGCETIYHCATPFTYWDGGTDQGQSAVDGVANMVRAAVRVKARRLILTASSVVFGSGHEPAARTERDTPDPAEPVSPYMAAKLRQWSEARRLARRSGLSLIAVCPTVVVGPHDYRLSPSNGVVVNYLNDPLRSTFPGGINVVAAADVARGHILAARRGKPGTSYILGGQNVEWRELHTIIADLAGLPAPRQAAGRAASYLAASAWELWAAFTGTRPAVTRHEARMVGRYYWYDHSAAAGLGYRPRNARTALAEALSWLVTRSYVSGRVRRTLRIGPEVYAARSAWTH
jgi:dihydroflavonol-4-reductase